MKILIRTTDPVLISFVESLLNDAGIGSQTFDTHMSVMDGSIGALPRRICVAEEDWTRAVSLLHEAEIEAEIYVE